MFWVYLSVLVLGLVFLAWARWLDQHSTEPMASTPAFVLGMILSVGSIAVFCLHLLAAAVVRTFFG